MAAALQCPCSCRPLPALSLFRALLPPSQALHQWLHPFWALLCAVERSRRSNPFPTSFDRPGPPCVFFRYSLTWPPLGTFCVSRLLSVSSSHPARLTLPVLLILPALREHVEPPPLCHETTGLRNLSWLCDANKNRFLLLQLISSLCRSDNPGPFLLSSFRP